jgi:hypothetical protein
MRVKNPSSAKLQQLFAPPNLAKDLGQRPSLAIAILAYMAATLLIAATCAQSLQYGWETGSARSDIHGAIMAAAALGAALAAPISWLAASRCFARWQIGRGLVAIALGLGCLGFGTLASLGFTTTTRDALQAQRGAGADEYRNAAQRHAAAAAELQALQPSRPATELLAIIETASDQRRLAALRVELARSEKREELKRAIQAADADMRTAAGRRSGTVNDPQAVALAAYAAALGFDVRPERIGPWVSLVLVVFFELAAGTSLVVASAASECSRRPPPGATPQTPPTAETPPSAAPRPLQAAQTPANDSSDGRDYNDEPPAPRRGRPRRQSLGAMADRIRERGGAVDGSLASLGTVLGTGAKATTHRALAALVAAGTVRVQSTSAGTRVVLA